MTAQTLRARSLKDLAALARKRGIDGWRSMRKDQLVRELLRLTARSTTPVSKSPAKKAIRGGRANVAVRNGSQARGVVSSRGRSNQQSRASQDPRIAKRLEQAKVRLMRAQDSGHGRIGRT